MNADKFLKQISAYLKINADWKTAPLPIPYTPDLAIY